MCAAAGRNDQFRMGEWGFKCHRFAKRRFPERHPVLRGVNLVKAGARERSQAVAQSLELAAVPRFFVSE